MENQLQEQIQVYFTKREQEKKADALLKEQVRKLTEVYLTQHGRVLGSFQTSDNAVTSTITSMKQSINSFHANLFVTLAVGKICLERLKSEEFESLCSVATNLVKKRSSVGTVFQTKLNQKYKYEYRKLSSTDGSVQGRHQYLTMLLDLFNMNSNDLLVLSKLNVPNEGVAEEEEEDEAEAEVRSKKKRVKLMG